jgi:hypothetical protein
MRNMMFKLMLGKYHKYNPILGWVLGQFSFRTLMNITLSNNYIDNW